MTTYEYYTKYYAFKTIPEAAFEGVMERARAVLEKIKSTYRVSECRIPEELALYRMAEEIYRDDQYGDLKQSKAGNVAVIYADREPLNVRLFRIASANMTIYRGVSSDVQNVQ